MVITLIEAMRDIQDAIPEITGFTLRFQGMGSISCHFMDNRPSYHQAFGGGIPDTVKQEDADGFIQSIKKYLATGKVTPIQ